LFRLAELLPEKQLSFDKTSNLLWKDITLLEDRAIFKIKSPKINTAQNRRVVLFKLKEKRFCPVSALFSLKKELKNKNLFRENRPVFLQGSGKSLNKKVFLEAANSILNIEGTILPKLSGKSFRSGIPSELSGFPSDLGSERVLKTLGRWKGPYQKYIRDPIPENHWIFNSVSSFLLNKLLLSRREEKDEKEADHRMSGHQ
jgi:hypothetical protein